MNTSTIAVIIVVCLALLYIGTISNITMGFWVREPPHFYRRYGLSPHNCPFRDDYY